MWRIKKEESKLSAFFLFEVKQQLLSLIEIRQQSENVENRHPTAPVSKHLAYNSHTRSCKTKLAKAFELPGFS